MSVTYSKLDGKHLLESWIPLLALFARDSGRDWSAVCIGRPKQGTTPRVEGSAGPTVTPSRCCATWWRSTTRAVASRFRLPVKTSYAWAAARHAGDDPERAARYRWKTNTIPGRGSGAGARAGVGQERARCPI